VQVLIVDDQPAFRRAAARVLARLSGFELVGEVDTGEASVEAARRLKPDLVLMDIHLPGIDGTEATRRILADADGARADKRPVVFLLSTYDAADYAGQTAACGAAAYLPKAQFGAAALVGAWARRSPRARRDAVGWPPRGDRGRAGRQQPARASGRAAAARDGKGCQDRNDWPVAKTSNASSKQSTRAASGRRGHGHPHGTGAEAARPALRT
jgi:CheY-like chemotaxis protein